MKLLSFDIEISNVFNLRPGEDINKYAPFDVAVAATQVEDGESRLWFAADKDGKPLQNMDHVTATALLEYLENMQNTGYSVCAWNGLSFDLRWIARAANAAKLGSKVAKLIYDPLFQFVKIKGFPIGLAAVGKGMGISTRKIMAAADAPKEWAAGNREKVCEYVLGDARMTNEIVRAILTRKQVQWITQKGESKCQPLPRLKPVAECLKDPMPDQSWMKNPPRQRDFVDWLGE